MREDVNANVFVTVVGLWLSAVEYGPLFHSRHNVRDRTGKVGHEIRTYLVCCFRARFKPFQDEVSVVIKDVSIIVFLPPIYIAKFSLGLVSGIGL